MPVKPVFILFCIMPSENQSQPKLQHAMNEDDLIISMNSVSGFYACIITTNCFEI
jgi:hypothetical protein